MEGFQRHWHKSQWCWNSSVGYQNCTRTEDLPTKLPQSISTTLHAMRRPHHSLTRRCRFSANLLHQGKIHSVRTRKMSRILTPPLGPCTHFGPKEVSNPRNLPHFGLSPLTAYVLYGCPPIAGRQTERGMSDRPADKAGRCACGEMAANYSPLHYVKHSHLPLH